MRRRFTDDVEFSLQRILHHHVRPALDKNLPDNGFARLHRRTHFEVPTNGNVAPPQHHLAFPTYGTFQFLFAGRATRRLLRQEDHSDAVVPRGPEAPRPVPPFPPDKTRPESESKYLRRPRRADPPRPHRGDPDCAESTGRLQWFDATVAPLNPPRTLRRRRRVPPLNSTTLFVMPLFGLSHTLQTSAVSLLRRCLHGFHAVGSKHSDERQGKTVCLCLKRCFSNN